MEIAIRGEFTDTPTAVVKKAPREGMFRTHYYPTVLYVRTVRDGFGSGVWLTPDLDSGRATESMQGRLEAALIIANLTVEPEKRRWI